MKIVKLDRRHKWHGEFAHYITCPYDPQSYKEFNKWQSWAEKQWGVGNWRYPDRGRWHSTQKWDTKKSKMDMRLYVRNEVDLFTFTLTWG